MLQRYKLRLGDGTVLLVDRAGLGTWTVDDAAMVQAVGSQRWQPLKQFLAHERVIARQAQAAQAREDVLPDAPARPPEKEPEPVIPTPDPTERPAFLPPSDPGEPISIGEPAGVQALADEPVANAPASGPHPTTPAGDLPVIPLKPLEDEAPPTSAPRPWTDPEPVPARARSDWAGDREELPSAGETPMADDERPGTRSRVRAGQDSGAMRRYTARIVDEEGAREKPLRSGLAGTLLRMASGLGTFLSRCLDPLKRLERGLSEWPPIEDEPAPPDRPASRPRVGSAPHRTRDSGAFSRPEVGVLAEDPLERSGRDAGRSAPGSAILRLKPVVADGWSRAATTLRQISGRASVWVGDLTARIGRVASRSSSSAPSGSLRVSDQPHPWSEPGVSDEPAMPRPPGLEPPKPLQPPPSLAALPVLRLAPGHEPKDREDVYEGESFEADEDAFSAADLVQAVWPRAKRFLVIAAVLAGALWAWLARETWTPAVTRLGRTAFTEIDGRVRARHEAERLERALGEATRQMPYLAPETLEIVLSNSPTGILDPPEVFRLAADAVDRGSSALTAEERRELRRLRRDLFARLSAVERDELRDYDRARAERTTFTFEDQEALRLFARGARGLPSSGRERLQVLSGKAIAAAFATGDEPTP